MDPEIEGDSGDTYKLIDDVVSMVEKIKSCLEPNSEIF